MISTRQWCSVLLVVAISMVIVATAESLPDYFSGDRFEIQRRLESPYEYNDAETPSHVSERLIRKLVMRAIEGAYAKRTVDFGLGRGLSGAIEAKHRLGMAAANFAGGPGRRRRSENSV